MTEGAKHDCVPVWSNDICARKAACYRSNHGDDHFHLGSIEAVSGEAIPYGDIVWASFPCQDLSLAGKMGGLAASRSGLFWEWLRVLDEMPCKPSVIALENVVGLLSANGGEDYRLLHRALQQRDYKVGPMLLDARQWLPHSRPRVFVVAVAQRIDSTLFEDSGPSWIHPLRVRKAMAHLEDCVFWSLPLPPGRTERLSDLIEWDAPCFESEQTRSLMAIIAPRHLTLLEKLPKTRRAVFPGYRRTRNGKQVLELRFDDTSGCLRTAEGGSSRQFLILRDRGQWKARLITTREAARLMGAPDSYRLPASYNEAYNAMGDAVAVPVVKHLVDHLLAPLARIGRSHVTRSFTASPRVRLIA